MRLIDSHTHIYLDDFKGDFDQMIERARAASVELFCLPNIDVSTIDAVNKLRELDPDVFFPMMGLHPCSVKDDYEEQLEIVFSEFEKRDYIAVGEIGIDLYWDDTHVNEQREAFRRQIRFAKEKGLPIVIHARDSFDEIFKIVDEENDESLTGIFHCFTGTARQASKILDYGGFYIGLGGVMTFKNTGLDREISDIDLKHIVLETDAPYLAPHPNRGKRNEPAFMRFTAEKLAEIKGVSPEEVAEITTNNVLELFKIGRE